jgi:hypothetical protein
LSLIVRRIETSRDFPSVPFLAWTSEQDGAALRVRWAACKFAESLASVLVRADSALPVCACWAASTPILDNAEVLGADDWLTLALVIRSIIDGIDLALITRITFTAGVHILSGGVVGANHSVAWCVAIAGVSSGSKWNSRAWWTPFALVVLHSPIGIT